MTAKAVRAAAERCVRACAVVRMTNSEERADRQRNADACEAILREELGDVIAIAHCENCCGDYVATGMGRGCACKILARAERAEAERDEAVDLLRHVWRSADVRAWAGITAFLTCLDANVERK